MDNSLDLESILSRSDVPEDVKDKLLRLYSENEQLKQQSGPADSLMQKIYRLFSIFKGIAGKKPEIPDVLDIEVYKKLTENMYDGMLIIQPSITGRADMAYLGGAIERILGYQPEELKGRNALDFIHPDDRMDSIMAMMTSLAYPEKPIHHQFRGLHKEGHYVELEGEGRNFLDDLHIKGIAVNFRDVTEQTLSRKRYESIVNCSPRGMHIYELVHNPDDPENTKLFLRHANTSADRILGIQHAGLIGKTIEEAFPPLINTEVPELYKKLALSGGEWSTEQINYQDEHKGIDSAYEVVAFYLFKNHMVATFTDIKERLQRNYELRKSEALHRFLVENTSDMISSVALDPYDPGDFTKMKVAFISPSVERLRGFTIEEAMAQDITDMFSPESYMGLMRTFIEKFPELLAQKSTDPVITSAELTRKDGGYTPVEIVVRLFYDNEKPIALLVNTREIIERVEAEKKLRESEELFRTVADVLGHGVWVRRLDDKFSGVYFSPSSYELRGLSPEEIKDHDLWDVVTKESLDNLLKIYETEKPKILLKEPVKKTVRMDYYHKDGHIVPTLTTISVLYRDDGMNYIVGVSTDITERLNDQKELEMSNDKFMKIFYNNPSVMAISSIEDGRFIDINSAFEEKIGYKRLSVVGMTSADLGLFKDYDKRAEIIKELNDTGTVNEKEVNIIRADGSIINALFYATKIIIDGKDCLLTVMSDITNTKNLEPTLRMMDRQAEMGALAGAAAHEMNNTLAEMMGGIELLGMSVDRLKNMDPEQIKTYLGYLQRGADRSRQFTRQLLDLARKEEEIPYLNGLDAVADDALTFLAKKMAQNGVTITKKYEPNMQPILAKHRELRQVMINLIMNAGDAISDKGDIYLRVYKMTEEGKNYAVLEVQDTGKGIPPEFYSKVFTPFETTKQDGNGIGLKICKDIIEEHGGRISFTSELGVGSTFKFKIPYEGRR
ncbi:MAG: PAS domain S-box protein [Nanoarchaeota archaeon]|nr:PAS domain S-box protein [Nanoarchaeota archaeon]